MANFWRYHTGGIALVYAYVAITGDETGEGLLPIVKNAPSIYPFGLQSYDSSKYGINNTNTTKPSNDTTITTTTLSY